MDAVLCTRDRVRLELQARQLAELTSADYRDVLDRLGPTVEEEARRKAAALMLAHAWLCVCTEPKRATALGEAIAVALGMHRAIGT